MDRPEFSWCGRRVLVTGCTGFLGSTLVRELLNRGTEVVGLVRDRAADVELSRHKLTGHVHIIHGRVEDTFRIHSALAVYEPSLVYHLATVDPNQPDAGVATVIEAVRRFDPRTPVIVARRAQNFGATGTAGILANASSPVPLGVASFGEIFGGADRKIDRIVPRSILALLSGEMIGRPPENSKRDFVYVRDAAQACLAVGEWLASHATQHREDFSFQSGWFLSSAEMAALIREVFTGRVAQPPLTRTVANPLLWSPRLTLPEAIAETITWYRELPGNRLLGKQMPPLRSAA